MLDQTRITSWNESMTIILRREEQERLLVIKQKTSPSYHALLIRILSAATATPSMDSEETIRLSDTSLT